MYWYFFTIIDYLFFNFFPIPLTSFLGIFVLLGKNRPVSSGGKVWKKIKRKIGKKRKGERKRKKKIQKKENEMPKVK